MLREVARIPLLPAEFDGDVAHVFSGHRDHFRLQFEHREHRNEKYQRENPEGRDHDQRRLLVEAPREEAEGLGDGQVAVQRHRRYREDAGGDADAYNRERIVSGSPSQTDTGFG